MLATLIFSTFLFTFIIILVFTRKKGILPLAHPLTLYLIFHGIVFILRPWYIYLFNDWTQFANMWINPLEEDLIRALFMADVALVSFVFGYFYLIPKRLASSIRFQKCSLKRNKIFWIGCIFLFLGILSIIYYSPLPWIEGRTWVQMLVTERGQVYTETSGYFVQAGLFIGSILVLWAALFRFSWWVIILIISYFGVRFYYGWGRWSFLLGFLGLMFVYLWLKERKWPHWRWLFLIPVVLIFFNLAATEERRFARKWVRKEVSFLESVKDYNERLFSLHDFQSYDFLVYVQKFVPEVAGYSYGTQYLKLFTWPIPRMIWSNKPVQTNIVNLNNYGNFWGCTVSIVGDTYMVAGWVSLIIGMMVVGAVLGFLHMVYECNIKIPWFAISYLLFLALLPQLFRDGGVTIFVFSFFNVFPALVTGYFSRRKFKLKNNNVVRA